MQMNKCVKNTENKYFETTDYITVDDEQLTIKGFFDKEVTNDDSETPPKR